MIVLVMGVSGAGKTTIGTLLAEQLNWIFADADSYHSPENVKKMAAGIPLTDADRAPWLATLRQLIESWISNGENAVLACSALREAYRRQLHVSADVKLVYLHGELSLIHERMLHRTGHYMDPKLLESQFETLEEPADAIVVDVAATPPDIVRQIRSSLAI